MKRDKRERKQAELKYEIQFVGFKGKPTLVVFCEYFEIQMFFSEKWEKVLHFLLNNGVLLVACNEKDEDAVKDKVFSEYVRKGDESDEN